MLDLVDQWLRAHYATDADALLAHDAETVLYVREGEVLIKRHADLLRMYSDDLHADLLRMYSDDFHGAIYQTWEYMEPPRIRISDDGSLAWVISRVHVSRTKARDGGALEAQEFIYAGINTYEKRDGAWRRVANVSTFADDV